MSKTTKTQRPDWKINLEHQAKLLEQQATTTRVIAMAETERDAFAVAFDLLAANAHSISARNLRAAGRSAPRPPAPISRLLTQVMDTMHEKLLAVGALLTEEQRSRLAAIGPRVLDALDEDDVRDAIATLLPLSPDAIVFWVAFNLGEIEARFAS